MNRIHNAIIYAAKKHEGQVRKGTDIPYIVHPMEVMQILTAAGCEEDVVVAGILHDTVEDTDATIEEISALFGERIAHLVANESEDKSKTWRERKSATIEHLKNCSDEEALCALADKLSNARSILADYVLVGEKLWERFNKDKFSLLWYYSQIRDAAKRFSAISIWQEYSACVEEMRRIIEGY